MSYNITQFDGTPLVTVVDGSFNDAVTDIKLLGKGVTNYGEIMAENLVWMTEHFANDAEPPKPLVGQIWFDTTTGIQRAFVYKGAVLGWVSLGGAASQVTAPVNPLKGDLWYDTGTQQLKVYADPLHDTGSAGWDVIGPALFFDSQPTTEAVPTIQPSGGLDGDLWWDFGNKQLYVYNDVQGQFVLVGPLIPGGVNSVPTTAVTGMVGSTVNDGSDHFILKVVVEDEEIGIWSQDDVGSGFTPSISGFTTLDNGLNVLKDLVPAADSVSDLGTALKRWKTLYVDSIEVASSILNNLDMGGFRIENLGAPNSGDDALNRDFGDTRYLRRDVGTTPTVDNSYDLGSASFAWKKLFVHDLEVLGSSTTILDMGGFRIENLGDPDSGDDAFNRDYGDNRYLRSDQTSLPNADETYNLGSGSFKWANIYATTFQGEATSAQYADVAERFATDSSLEPGDVVELGGEAEITKSTSEMSLDVFGVVSTNPAYMMNSDAGPDMTHPYVALTGRVPVKCIGKVTKGQRLVTSHVPGAARGINNGTAGSNILAILGRALEDKNTEELGMIEVAIGVK